MLTKIKDFVAKIINTVELSIGKVHWPAKAPLSEAERDKIKQLLIPNHYIILTRRSNHLSTFFISLASLFVSGEWSYWAHSVMNLENDVKTPDDFRLVEAIGSGVRVTPFDKVFDVDGVVLLKPKSMSVDRWTLVLDKARTELGKPYDTLFDLKSDKALSCVELVRTSLMAEPTYATDFANFEAMISKHGNLTPQMFYDCPDFEVVYEIRHKQ